MVGQCRENREPLFIVAHYSTRVARFKEHSA